MRLVEELMAELWGSEELRVIEPEALGKLAEEFDMVDEAEIRDYREAVERAARILAVARLKKILGGAEIPEESIDSGLLRVVGLLVNMLSSLYAGMLPAAPSGRILVEAEKPFLLGDMVVPEGSYVLVEPSEIVGALVEERVSIVAPGTETPKKPESR